MDEAIVGGAKIKLALYSSGDKNYVLCGIQAGKDDSCMFYVHHIDTISHERLKSSGKGKHAKKIRYLEENEIIDEDINWLISKIEESAPF